MLSIQDAGKIATMKLERTQTFVSLATATFASLALFFFPHPANCDEIERVLLAESFTEFCNTTEDFDSWFESQFLPATKLDSRSVTAMSRLVDLINSSKAGRSIPEFATGCSISSLAGYCARLTAKKNAQEHYKTLRLFVYLCQQPNLSIDLDAALIRFAIGTRIEKFDLDEDSQLSAAELGSYATEFIAGLKPLDCLVLVPSLAGQLRHFKVEMDLEEFARTIAPEAHVSRDYSGESVLKLALHFSKIPRRRRVMNHSLSGTWHLRKHSNSNPQDELLDAIDESKRSPSERQAIASFLLLNDHSLSLSKCVKCLRVLDKKWNRHLAAASNAALKDYASQPPNWKTDAMEVFELVWSSNDHRTDIFIPRSCCKLAILLDLPGKAKSDSFVLFPLSGDDIKAAIVAEAPEKCVQYIREIWDGAMSYSDERVNGTFCSLLEQNKETLVEQFSTAEEKYLADVYLSSFSDVGQKSWFWEKSTSDRQTRLKGLAKRFSEIKFSSQRRKEFAVMLLAKSVESAPFIFDELKELTAELSPDDFIIHLRHKQYLDWQHTNLLMQQFVECGYFLGDESPTSLLNKILDLSETSGDSRLKRYVQDFVNNFPTIDRLRDESAKTATASGPWSDFLQRLEQIAN